jgi:hypothetical protein
MVKGPVSGYSTTMRFRLGLVTGFATGYYLGTRAGRQRYDQINRTVARLRRTDAFEQAAERAKTVVEEGVEKARAMVPNRAANGHNKGNYTDGSGSHITGSGPDDATGLPEPPTGLGGYSSSR